MTIIVSIHQEEMHFGRSPVGSPVIAANGSIYNYVTNKVNNDRTFGTSGQNVLQGRSLTHPGGTGSGNELLIPAMKAGTSNARRLTGVVRQGMTEYYGFFKAFSKPEVPYNAFRQGLDDSYNDIIT
jgi:hypothetical protein